MFLDRCKLSTVSNVGTKMYKITGHHCQISNIDSPYLHTLISVLFISDHITVSLSGAVHTVSYCSSMWVVKDR